MVKNSFFWGFFALAFCMIETHSAHALGRSPSSSTPSTTSSTPAYAYSAEELEGIRLVNEYRASLGLSQVTQNDFISNQCVNHNNYMIQRGILSHDGYTDRQTAIQKYFGIQRVGEVVAYNFSSPKYALNVWLNSPSHKAIIIGQYFKRIGYSIRADANGKKYHTMIFSE